MKKYYNGKELRITELEEAREKGMATGMKQRKHI